MVAKVSPCVTPNSIGLIDLIHVEQLEVGARIGVTDEERADPQRLTISVTLRSKADFDRLEDDIQQTINYVDVCAKIKTMAMSRQWNLIETLASEVASHLLANFPMNTVEVEVRKFVLPNTKYVSATVHRQAAPQ
ncbi:MAG: dihydroneopterin aldolase [Chthoniobacterales bacterium]